MAISAFGPSYTMAKAMGGDMVFDISPATCAGVAGTGKAASSRTVTISLKAANGAVHTWCNQAFATKLSVSDTSTPTPTIVSTTLTLVNGVASVVITLPTGDYGGAEINTLTLANVTLMGYTVTGGTSVQTFA